jgi:hypothetical protein
VIRPLLAVAAVAVLMLGSLAAGYGWGNHGKRAATVALAQQLTLAEAGLATRAEVEHDWAVCHPLVVNGPYQPRSPYDSPARSGAESVAREVRT